MTLDVVLRAIDAGWQETRAVCVLLDWCARLHGRTTRMLRIVG